VISGNRAWRAAAEVRKRWLASLFARRTAPREVAVFVARQLLTMPDPVRSGLAAAPGRVLFSEITGQPAASWLEACDTIVAGRVPLLMLGPIVTAFEQAMTEGEGRNTWRLDRYSPCPRNEAGRYLAFLGTLGYQLSDIERAVAENEPYAGDGPLADSLDARDEPVTPAGKDAPATADDVSGETGSGAVDSCPVGTDSGTGHSAA
jgi:ParB family transcriptional regulator, chromosome partitioning protein